MLEADLFANKMLWQLLCWHYIPIFLESKGILKVTLIDTLEVNICLLGLAAGFEHGDDEFKALLGAKSLKFRIVYALFNHLEI